MMKCQEVREEEKQNIQERFSLAIARIQAMEEEETVPQPYRDFFRKTASYILWAGKQTDLDYTEYSLEELQQMNQESGVCNSSSGSGLWSHAEFPVFGAAGNIPLCERVQMAGTYNISGIIHRNL